jgi:hypothetical protein
MLYPLAETTRHRQRRHYRSSRRHFKDGKRAAALRAITAARLYASGAITLEAAATSCGSNVAYVKAAATLLKAENRALLDNVLIGSVGLLRAAAQVRRLVDFLEAYRKASPEDLVKGARAIGVNKVWADLIEPAIGVDEVFAEPEVFAENEMFPDLADL